MHTNASTTRVAARPSSNEAVHIFVSMASPQPYGELAVVAVDAAPLARRGDAAPRHLGEIPFTVEEKRRRGMRKSGEARAGLVRERGAQRDELFVRPHGHAEESLGGRGRRRLEVPSALSHVLDEPAVRAPSEDKRGLAGSKVPVAVRVAAELTSLRLLLTTTFVDTSVSAKRLGGSVKTSTLSADKAERARNAAIKIAAPNFMRVFYHKSPSSRQIRRASWRRGRFAAMGFEHLEGAFVGLPVRETEAVDLAHPARAAEIAVFHDLDPAAEPPFHLGLQFCQITCHIVTLSSLFIPRSPRHFRRATSNHN